MREEGNIVKYGIEKEVMYYKLSDVGNVYDN